MLVKKFVPSWMYVEDQEWVEDFLLTAKGTCVFTGKPYETGPFRKSHVQAFWDGAHVQDAFPDLSADDREFILSGISPTGWESLAPADDE